MEILTSKLHLAILTVISLCVFSYEVTVRSTDLMRCKDDDKVCVTNLRACDPRLPSSVQKTLNLSCYYLISQESVTCEWSQDSDRHTESDVFLIFRKRTVLSCEGLFYPASTMNIIARIKSYDADIWSQPHPIFLFEAMKPDPPVLTVAGSTQDSVVVSWHSTRKASCRIRYRVNSTQTWSQDPGFVHTYNNQQLVYVIKDLLPFNVYIAAAACRETFGFWSDWSSGVTAMTLERVPSKSPQVHYRLEKTDSGGRLVLHLMWKALDRHDSGGRILGYQVRYRLVTEQQLQDRFIQNITQEVALIVVEEGQWSVTVTAFNAAGYGPAAHLSIDTQRQNSPLPSVGNMWVSSSFPAVKGLLVQWRIPTDLPPPALPVSHFDVQWHAESYPSTSRWTTLDRSTTSTLIQDVEPDESYLISVFPVYKQQRGASQSLNASLQQGALTEVAQLKLIGVSKTTVTVAWAWQKKSAPVRVNRYRMMLRSGSGRQMQSLWPDQWQHTFLNLTPSTEYSLVLLADDVTRFIIPVSTSFDEFPVVATAMPLLLLAVALLIVSILSRTVFKGYFFPHISSPRNSTAGQWLMDTNRKSSTQQNILDIKDLQETDLIGVKSAIVLGPRWCDLHEDAALLPLGHFSIHLSDVKLDTEYVSNTPLTTEHRLQWYLPDKAPVSDGSREAPLLHSWFPQEEEEQRHVDCRTSGQANDVVKCCFHKLMGNADDHCVNQITCEPEYVVNASYQRKKDVETVSEQTDCSLICDTDYISNISTA